MALKKKCVICGTEYKYCYTCSSNLKDPSWMMIFDKENCKNIYEILAAKIANKLTEKEAADKLNQCDLSNIKNFNNKMKERIDEILSQEEVVLVSLEENISFENYNNESNNEIENKISEVIEETKEEINIVENITEEKFEENSVLKRQKMRHSSKKSNK